MAPAMKCAAFHLMWAKVNVVNSKPTEVLVSCYKTAVVSSNKVSNDLNLYSQTHIRLWVPVVSVYLHEIS